MQKILGKELSQGIIEQLKTQPVPKKIFAAILVGDDPSSINFVAQKEKLAKSLGIDFRIYRFGAGLKNDPLRKAVREIALKKPVGGVIIQLPLPEHVNKHYVLNVVPPEKDVDVLGERALGAFYAGRSRVLPPAVGTVQEILNFETSNMRHETRELTSLRVAVVGAGFLIGKPIAHYLQDKVAKLTTFTSKSKDLHEKLKEYDVVVSGVGKANLFSADDVKDDALVIDFGWDVVGGKINGDFNSLSDLRNLKSEIRYTPTPGGTGPILVAKLIENFYELNKKGASPLG